MPEDIREQPSITHADVTALNFVRSSPPWVFRRHFRQGLRSHIMEILDPAEVEIEQSGTLIDGMRRFPRAAPHRMFRIFRSRLKTIDRALTEIGRVKTVERYLAPDFMATSTECIVDYRGPDGWDLLLCGFQEYVEGEILDPWTLLDATELLPALYDTLGHRDAALPLSRDEWIRAVRQNSGRFVKRIKRMIVNAGHIPDLAGAGNLMATVHGHICLVDINNISPIHFDSAIDLDEKGYPVCDKSIEALSLIEEKILGRPVDMNEPLYRLFLDRERRKAIARKERVFWDRNASSPKNRGTSSS
jgi:hypothetical protein